MSLHISVQAGNHLTGTAGSCHDVLRYLEQVAAFCWPIACQAQFFHLLKDVSELRHSSRTASNLRNHCKNRLIVLLAMLNLMKSEVKFLTHDRVRNQYLVSVTPIAEVRQMHCSKTSFEPAEH